MHSASSCRCVPRPSEPSPPETRWSGASRMTTQSSMEEIRRLEGRPCSLPRSQSVMATRAGASGGRRVRGRVHRDHCPDPCRSFAVRALLSLAGTWVSFFAEWYASYLAVLEHVSPPCRLTEEEEAHIIAAVAAEAAASSRRTDRIKASSSTPYESASASMLPAPLRARDAYLAALRAAEASPAGPRTAVLLPTPPRLGVGCALRSLRMEAFGASGGASCDGDISLPTGSQISGALASAVVSAVVAGASTTKLECAEVVRASRRIVKAGASAAFDLFSTCRLYVWPAGLQTATIDAGAGRLVDAMGRSAASIAATNVVFAAPLAAAYAVLCGDVQRTLLRVGGTAESNAALALLDCELSAAAAAPAASYAEYAAALSLADTTSPRKRALLLAVQQVSSRQWWGSISGVALCRNSLLLCSVAASATHSSRVSRRGWRCTPSQGHRGHEQGRRRRRHGKRSRPQRRHWVAL